MTERANQPFPWGPVMHLCLGRLRLDPKSFWAMSPREIFALLGGLAPQDFRLGRADLDRLIAEFPD